MLLDKKIVKKILYLFYYTLICFVINLIQTLLTLFLAYLKYFESKYFFLTNYLELSSEYPNKIGLELTFLMIFSTFLVIIINSCLILYTFLMTSKFYSYSKY